LLDPWVGPSYRVSTSFALFQPRSEVEGAAVSDQSAEQSASPKGSVSTVVCRRSPEYPEVS
jgi:hypothetical protein